MNSWVRNKKLTKANSYMSGDRIFWLGKKMDNEKPSKQYWAYLYPFGYAVRGEDTKQELHDWIDDNLPRIEERIKALGIST